MKSTRSELEDIRMLFETRVSEIEYFKQKQWHATNYGMLTYAAIIGLLGVAIQSGAHIVFVHKYIATGLIFFSLIVLFGAITQLNKSLQASRESVKSSLHYFSSKFFRSYNVKWATIDDTTRDGPFPDAFHAYNIIGAVIAGWFVWCIY